MEWKLAWSSGVSLSFFEVKFVVECLFVPKNGNINHVEPKLGTLLPEISRFIHRASVTIFWLAAHLFLQRKVFSG